jgi:hypothetical protein
MSRQFLDALSMLKWSEVLTAKGIKLTITPVLMWFVIASVCTLVVISLSRWLAVRANPALVRKDV